MTRASFDLDADKPNLTVEAAYIKRRREDHLPLRPNIASLLALRLASKLPTARAFKFPMLAYRDHAGLVVDFHSLRHTFISSLARAGVYPKLAQSLARHSDINLTMSRYTHTTRGERSEPWRRCRTFRLRLPAS